MSDNEFDGMTFSPEEFVMRFAPEAAPEVPKLHSPAWAYTVMGSIHGIVFAETQPDAIARLKKEYTAANGEPVADADITTLIRIDDDQDIIEIS